MCRIKTEFGVSVKIQSLACRGRILNSSPLRFFFLYNGREDRWHRKTDGRRSRLGLVLRGERLCMGTEMNNAMEINHMETKKAWGQVVQCTKVVPMPPEVVIYRDLPEATTQGDMIEEALEIGRRYPN